MSVRGGGSGDAGLGALRSLPRAFSALRSVDRHRHCAVAIGTGPVDCAGDLGLAGECELGGSGVVAFGGLLLLVEEADVFLALVRSQLFCVGDGVRNNPSIFTLKQADISMLKVPRED